MQVRGSKHRTQKLCESRGGRPGLPGPNSPFSLWRCTVIPENLVLRLDGVCSPQNERCQPIKAHIYNMSSGEITGEHFHSLEYLVNSLVYQIHNKQMPQLVAYSANICVWFLSCNECGGWQLGRHSARIKWPIDHMSRQVRSRKA